MRIAVAWLCLAVVLPSASGGQISGVIADQIAQRRVPGAVVTVLDSTRHVIVRALADDSGRFRIASAAGARRLRIVKIGYRPAEVAVSPTASIQVALERLPNLLEPVLTSDQPRCPRSPTRPAAFGLWEQARAALLGTVVARETNSAEVLRLNFRRYMTPKGDAIVRQSVRRDSGLAMRSFDATFPASEFMKRGFASPEGSRGIRFYGPDAEVLLDDALVDAYCLDLAEPQRDRPNQAGLRFRPMARQPGRVDLDGTLWIDTTARVLQGIEYRYIGLEGWANPLLPGGTISFLEMSPTTVWIDKWMIRMTGAAIDNGRRPILPPSRRHVSIDEGGAELASARWPDGHVWTAALGSAIVRLTTPNGVALAGARAHLDSTDYRGITDSTGLFLVTELLPGPYTISVYDSALAVVDTTLPASIGFTAARDSMSEVTAWVPSVTDFVAKECRDNDAFDPRSAIVVARIVTADSLPMPGAHWRIEPLGVPVDPDAPQGYYARGQTGPDGLVHVCARLTRGKRVMLRAWRPDKGAAEAAAVLKDHVTTLKIAFPKR